MNQRLSVHLLGTSVVVSQNSRHLHTCCTTKTSWQWYMPGRSVGLRHKDVRHERVDSTVSRKAPLQVRGHTNHSLQCHVPAGVAQ